ncbi:hypothetical protein [Campylobacter sp. MIT 97-5078]|uniref:hypothetical protein n=1 Tax=Campylobacter sp. MIT 97-5078 TaxID=1548153 RepID=UPI0005141BD2|nr:hypothetical protein [Campylobacter sp. MIT 97-5078]KGI55673.1 hypothetical protein LR59_11015 [Campylobacter sp. MIT 97-5078]KGI56805.1 hypothetical protein LR59_04790 [Campylobacter sp. MIT 97-5078]TQR25580.1 hypothetical protein DMB91_07190 [Campylobacter sp. MIT 97-5078]
MNHNPRKELQENIVDHDQSSLLNLDEDWDQPSLFDENDLKVESKSTKQYSYDEAMEKKLGKKMKKER